MAQRKKSGFIKWLIILILLGGAGGFGYWYYQQPRDKKVEYRTEVISRGDVIQAVTANGQLTPVKNVAVGSQISGNIKEIKADFNSRVNAGDIIAQIDPATYEQSVDQAEAELANAKAAEELASLNDKRATALNKEKLIAVSEAEKATADLHQAQAVVRTREAALKKAKVDLERTTIYAPISGVVISRNVDVGQTVAASFNTPTLFQIANDLAKMEIDAMVSEADVGGVDENQRVEFAVDAFPNRQFLGVVKQVRYAPTTNQNVVTYTAVVDVNNADLKLRPGMTATASIITAQRNGVIRVPNSALRFRPPESTAAKGTNATRQSRGTNQAGGSMSSGGSGGGPAGSGGGGGGGGMSQEERRRRFEAMTPEQQQAFRDRMRQRSAEGGGGGGGMGGGGRRGGDSSSGRVYVVGSTNSTDLKPVTIKIGISDGYYTEVVDGLKENDIVVTGLTTPIAAPLPGAQPGGGRANNPFGGGGGFRGGR